MKKIAYVLALLLTLSLQAYDSAISAKEVLYLPEEEKIELIGDISLTFEGWKFLAERGAVSYTHLTLPTIYSV